jgi:LysW-gamma-L-lysine carboxypeptidase
LDEVALLDGLLRQYSPTGRESGAVNMLVGAMNAMGFTAGVDAIGNAVGNRGAGPRHLVLLGHIDTVTGDIPVHQQDGCLYGRGSVDAKGPLACFTAAAARVEVPSGWRLSVIGAVGEEGDSRGARYLCQNMTPPDMVIIGEPSGWERVTLGYKGSLWFRYRVGVSLEHTAARGQSACEKAVAFWNRLEAACAAWNAGRERVFEQLTPSLREMNSASDGFTDTASLHVNLRLPTGLDQAALEAMVRAVMETGDFHTEDFIPAYRVEKNQPLERAFLAAIRKSGGQPGFTLKTGTADMNLAGPAWNCPVVAYGPGDSNLDHTPQEHILISEYRAGIDVLARVLETIMAGGF